MKYVLTKPSVRADPPVAFSALAAARAAFPGHWLLEAWGLQFLIEHVYRHRHF